MWPQSDVPQAKASKCPKITVLSRIVTLISLVISLGIMRSNRPIWVGGSAVYFIDYKKIGSYQYMLFSIIVGLAYNLLQTPFAAYYAIRGKRIINNTKFLLFEFYGDKVSHPFNLSFVYESSNCGGAPSSFATRCQCKIV
ncbi:hypothetical protein ACSBR1_039951 [Camellia fascicularis]